MKSSSRVAAEQRASWHSQSGRCRRKGWGLRDTALSRALLKMLALGAAAGALGDRWSLGFLAETERQVERHLEGHLSQLAPEDRKTRAVVAAMRDDEAKHRATAVALGAAELPQPVKQGMRAMAIFAKCSGA